MATLRTIPGLTVTEDFRPQIPGLEVTEDFRDPNRTFSRTAPPRPITSPEGLRASAALREPAPRVVPKVMPPSGAAPAAPEGSAARRMLNGLRSVPGNAVSAVRAMGNADVGQILKAAPGAIRQSSMAKFGALGVLGAGAAEGFDTSTEDMANQMGIDPVASTVPQFVKDVGIRTLGTLQRAGNAATFGLADRVGNALAGNDFERSPQFGGPAPTTSTAPGAPSALAVLPAGQRAETTAGLLPPRAPVDLRTTNTALPPTGPAIVRDGNSYGGAPGVRFGASFENPDGSAAQGRGTVSSLDTSAGYQSDLRQLARNAAERAAAPAPAQAFGFGSGATLSSSLRDSTNAQGMGLSAEQRMAANSSNGTDRRQARAQIAEQANLRIREAGDNARSLRSNETSQGIAELNNATQRRSNDQNNAVSLRGQDMELQGRMAPLQLAAIQRNLHAQVYRSVGVDGAEPSADQHLAAAARFDSAGLTEQAKAAREAANQMQTLRGARENQSVARSAESEKLFKPFFTRETVDKDGNKVQHFDEVGAAKAAATVRSIYGEKFDKLSNEQKNAVMTEIVARQRNMDAERQVMPSLFDRAKDMVGMYEKPPEATAPRDLRGGTLERAGLISPPGVSRNSTLVRLPNGQTINYGELTDEQLKQINERRTLR